MNDLLKRIEELEDELFYANDRIHGSLAASRRLL